MKVDWISVKKDLPKGLMVKVLASLVDEQGIPLVPEVVVYNGLDHIWETEHKVVGWVPLPEPYEGDD